MSVVNSYKTDLEEIIKENEKSDKNYQNLKSKIVGNEPEIGGFDYKLIEKGLIMYKNRLYVPNVPETKLLILKEVHKSPYSGHPGYHKMITMLRNDFFWPNIKNEVA